MFDRFSENARKAMGLARQAALNLNHDYIGTEHMLLGMIEERDGVAADVLARLDVQPEVIREEVEKRVARGSHQVTMGQLPFTASGKKALEHTVAAASNLGHSYIGTEHLLLGLITGPDGIAADALRCAGVYIEPARAAVKEVVGEGAVDAEPIIDKVHGAGAMSDLLELLEQQNATLIDRVNELEARVRRLEERDGGELPYV